MPFCKYHVINRVIDLPCEERIHQGYTKSRGLTALMMVLFCFVLWGVVREHSGINTSMCYNTTESHFEMIKLDFYLSKKLCYFKN